MDCQTFSWCRATCMVHCAILGDDTDGEAVLKGVRSNQSTHMVSVYWRQCHSLLPWSARPRPHAPGKHFEFGEQLIFGKFEAFCDRCAWQPCLEGL